jgi:hypothetical protein
MDGKIMMMTVVVVMIKMIMVMVVVIVMIMVVVVVTNINTRNEHGVQENIHKFNKMLSSCNIFTEIILELNSAH